MALRTYEITVKLDDMGRQLIARIAAVAPIVEAAIDHVRFPTPEHMDALESAVNAYLKLQEVDDESAD